MTSHGPARPWWKPSPAAVSSRNNVQTILFITINVIIEIVIKERGKRDDSERKRENKLDSERLSLLKYYGQTRLIHFSLEARFSPKLLAFTFI